MRVLLAFAHKRHVAYHAKHVLAIALIHGHRLLIVAGKQHLWPATHTQHLLMLIKRFGGEVARLLQKESI